MENQAAIFNLKDTELCCHSFTTLPELEWAKPSWVLISFSALVRTREGTGKSKPKELECRPNLKSDRGTVLALKISTHILIPPCSSGSFHKSLSQRWGLCQGSDRRGSAVTDASAVSLQRRAACKGRDKLLLLPRDGFFEHFYFERLDWALPHSVFWP